MCHSLNDEQLKKYVNILLCTTCVYTTYRTLHWVLSEKLLFHLKCNGVLFYLGVYSIWCIVSTLILSVLSSYSLLISFVLLLWKVLLGYACHVIYPRVLNRLIQPDCAFLLNSLSRVASIKHTHRVSLGDCSDIKS